MSTTAAESRVAHVITSDAEALAVAHAFAEQIAPSASERDRSRTLPVDELAALGRSGLLGIRVPRDLGGAAVSYATVAEVFRIVARADPSIAQVPQNHFHFIESAALVGSDDLKRRLLGDVLRGARLGNALSERGGRTSLDFTTRLTRHDDGRLRLNGRKYYSTGALTAQWIPVFALDDADQLVCAYVPRVADGVDVHQDWDAMGQRATVSGTTTLDDVVVDDELVLPFHRLSETPSIYAAYGQLMHVAIDVGIAQNAYEEAVAFVRTRSRPFFQADVERAAQDPHVIEAVGRLTSRLRAAEALLGRAAALLDEAAADPTPERIVTGRLGVAEAKPLVGEIAVELSSDIFAVAGTSASSDELNLHRHWRNARTHTLHDPAAWKYHVVGEHALTGDLPASHPLV